MKKIILSSLLLIPSLGFAAVKVGGAAIRGVDDLEANDSFAVLLDRTGSPFNIDGLNITADLPFMDPAAYGSDFSLLHTGSATSFFGTNLIEFNITGDFEAGASFGIVVFDRQVTGNLVADEAFSFYTNSSWRIPSDGEELSFSNSDSNALTQIDSNTLDLPETVSISGTVAVPEPSVYAAITGVLALGYVVARRRRRTLNEFKTFEEC